MNRDTDIDDTQSKHVSNNIYRFSDAYQKNGPIKGRFRKFASKYSGLSFIGLQAFFNPKGKLFHKGRHNAHNATENNTQRQNQSW